MRAAGEAPAFPVLWWHRVVIRTHAQEGTRSPAQSPPGPASFLHGAHRCLGTPAIRRHDTLVFSTSSYSKEKQPMPCLPRAAGSDRDFASWEWFPRVLPRPLRME